MRNLYLYSLILIAFIAIRFLYWTIILGISKQVFYSVTLTNTVLRPITEKVAMVTYSNWISLLNFDLSACPMAANPFPLFKHSK